MGQTSVWWYRSDGGFVAKSYSFPNWEYEAATIDKQGADESLKAHITANLKVSHYEPLPMPARRAA